VASKNNLHARAYTGGRLLATNYRTSRQRATVCGLLLVVRVAFGIGLCGGFAGFFAGCSGPAWATHGAHSSGTTLQAVGDWNDIDAAVEVAVKKAELAVVEARDATDERGRAQRVFTLVGLGNEPAELIVTAKGGAGDKSSLAQAGPVAMQLSASVGRFGDAAREKTLVNALRARLGQLSGVDFAPLR
jgi:hypothetical protein